jgi:hypothetical protein
MLWTRWKRLAHRAAEIQSFVVLTVVYWLLVAPIGAVQKLGRRRPAGPEWRTRPSVDVVSVEDARRQS